MKYQITEWHGDEKWVEVKVCCPETTAKYAAEHHLHETSDYGIVDSGETLRVRVMDDAGEMSEWDVRAEASIHFWADQV